MSSAAPDRTPVIVGVGEINDRPRDPSAGLDPAGLAAAAIAAADRDGGGAWSRRADRVALVPQISFPGLDVAGRVAKETGCPRDRVSDAGVASGDTPVRLLDEAAAAIRAGAARVCVIAGGEAIRTAAARGAGPLFAGSAASASDLRRRYGLVAPADIYPLYENATRAAFGQSLADAQAETGRIWAQMSKVANDAEGAWLKRPRTPAEIVSPDAFNRPIAHPYTKLMVANVAVNQGAAVVVASLAAARAAGIAEDALVHVGAGAAAHESDEPLDRDRWTTPPAMRAALEAVLARNGVDVDAIDLVELYSCFPCVPKMARRVLGWPVDRAVTVHGGLTFGGGPIGNYMTHAIAAMVRAIRAGARTGLLYANGGHCSHNHAVLLSRAAGAAVPTRDAQAAADDARGPIPTLTDAIEGAMPVETYTVAYARDGAPARGIVLSRAPSGDRVVARVAPEDRRSIAFLTDGAVEPVGRAGINRRAGDHLIWEAA